MSATCSGSFTLIAFLAVGGGTKPQLRRAAGYASMAAITVAAAAAIFRFWAEDCLMVSVHQQY
jgi:hypothetical protein